MSDEVRVNRPVSNSGGQQPMRQEYQPQGEMMPAAKNSKAPWIILVVVVVVLIVLGVLFRDKLFGASGASTAASGTSSGYQAVFLTNGQVYFGKLAYADSDYPVLTDIYYLQVVQPPLQGQQTAGQAAPAASAAQPQISLVKLGNELHGPVDEMHIARAQILFYEDMKTDSQVYKAIQSYKANTPAAVPAPSK